VLDFTRKAWEDYLFWHKEKRRKSRNFTVQRALFGQITGPFPLFFLLFLVFVDFFHLFEEIILKKRVQIPENADNFLDFAAFGVVKHRPLAGFEPLFAGPEGRGDKADNAVVDGLLAEFKIGDIALGNADFFGKNRLSKA